MSVTLYFSNQLLPLAERLQQNLLSPTTAAHVLDAPMVIVPNMNLSKWLKLTLSRRADVFMNVAFAYLEDGLWQLISALVPPTRPGVERLDRDGMTVVLFFILMDLDVKDEALEPIIRYLRQSDGGVRADFEIRCWQLAGELSRLFQEYEYHRADSIQRWCEGNPSEDVMERCQQRLYQHMQDLATRLGPILGRTPVSMREYARRIPRPSGFDDTRNGKPRSRVHFFGLSQISPFHIELLSRLQSGFDIHIYSLNPSREYWEDIQTPVEKKWIARKNVNALRFSEKEWDAGDLFSGVDHELLSAWGKPGRENIRLLCQLTDYDFDAGFADTHLPDTVLGAVNHGILTLATSPASPRDALIQDTSLQIMACPGIRREVETVYQSILYNLEHDPDLLMTDIAVMVSDMPRYKPVVDSVFGGMPERISYNLVDASARMESLFAQAVMGFMALARGTFSRKAVFDFLRNPCVQQRWAYTPEILSIWIAWADRLGIFHGFEKPNDSDPAIPGAGLFSWRQGLERLRLSRIMTPLSKTGGRARPHFNGLVPFADINTGDHRLLEKFCTLVPALHGAVTQFKTGTKTARQWRDIFLEVVDQFIEIAPDMRGEETVFQSLLDAFDHFARYDDLMQVASGQMLTAESLWAFAGSHLEGIAGGQGDYLTGGVTVSALMPMRPIPFKIVYVLGLEEGRFPGRTNDSLLDLRTRQRRIGDVSPAERNRYLFLEILISVRRKLYLSYVSKDLQKDRDLESCSVIHQLRRYMEHHLLGGRAFTIQHIPIRADSPRYLAADAVNGWSDVMVNANLAQRLSSYRRGGLWNDAAARLTSAEQMVVASYEPDFSLPAASPDDHLASTTGLTIGLLRRFLLDPVAVCGQYHLGAHERIDPEDELAQIENEPLASRFPVDYEIRGTTVQNWLVSGLGDHRQEPTLDALADEFDIVYADLTRRSKVPAGAFAQPDRSRLQGDVLACGATLLPHILAMRSARQLFSAVMLGYGAENGIETGGVQLNLSPLELPIFDGGDAREPCTIQLSGGLPWIWQAEDRSWHCLVVTGSGSKSNTPDKHILTPRLVLMAIAACDESYPWAGADGITVHVGYREHMQHHRYPLDPISSRAYLKALVEAVLTPWPLIWMPFATVFGTRSLIGYVKQGDISDVDRHAFAESMIAAMQAQAMLDPASELYGATVPENILDIARGRFGVFLPEG